MYVYVQKINTRQKWLKIVEYCLIIVSHAMKRVQISEAAIVDIIDLVFWQLIVFLKSVVELSSFTCEE